MGNFSRSLDCKPWLPLEKYEKYIKGKILDIGCGTGQALAGLIGCGELYGIDLNKDSFAYVQDKFPKVHFVVGDACHLPFEDKSFDFIFSLDTIECVKDYESMIKEAARVLKSDGVFVLRTPNYPIKRLYDFYHAIRWERNFRDDPAHISRFSAFKLKKVLDRHFKEVEIEARNIMFDRKLGLEKLRNSFLGRLLGQKIIALCKL